MQRSGMVELRIQRRLPSRRSQNGEPLRKKWYNSRVCGYYTIRAAGL